jgi:hypothetical protein
MGQGNKDFVTQQPWKAQMKQKLYRCQQTNIIIIIIGIRPSREIMVAPWVVTQWQHKQTTRSKSYRQTHLHILKK